MNGDKGFQAILKDDCKVKLVYGDQRVMVRVRRHTALGEALQAFTPGIMPNCSSDCSPEGLARDLFIATAMPGRPQS